MSNTVEDRCEICGLDIDHWFHYYGDEGFQIFLFQNCKNRPKVNFCFYSKFFLWFLLMPFLAVLNIIYVVFKSFQVFLYDSISFNLYNNDTCKKALCCLPKSILYGVVTVLFILCELIFPVLFLPFYLPVLYFIHCYAY